MCHFLFPLRNASSRPRTLHTMSCRRGTSLRNNDVIITGQTSSSYPKTKTLGSSSLNARLVDTKSTTAEGSSSKRPSKRLSSWISSSFDGFGESNEFHDKPRKKKQAEIQPVLPGTKAVKDYGSTKDGVLWLEKHRPKVEIDLAVHKKKIAEVRSWLLEHLCGKPSGAILLMTGPAGVGKTATLQVLAQELGCEVQEWVNPLTSFTEAPMEFHDRHQLWDSQISVFQDFLLRANKYPTLSIFGKGTELAVRKIILIEDLPNFIFRETGKLHELLSNYRQTGRSPVVFIISDSHHGNTSVHHLFPKDVQARLEIHNISFNPVAHTSLVKTINKIASTESRKAASKFVMPSKETVESLAQSCAGDIRAAINALQFHCLRERPCQSRGKSSYKSVSKKSSDKKISDNSQAGEKQHISQSTVLFKSGQSDDSWAVEDVTAIGGRDTTLFLFKSLGKILYCKRSSSLSDKDILPNHLSHCARNQLQFCPEDIIERTHLSSDFFNLYLHQNYLSFFSDVDDVVSASEYFSDADMVTADWMHRLTLREYTSSIASRGLMFSNHNRSTSATGGVTGGWRALHKPQWFEVSKKARDGCQTAGTLFRERGCPSVVLRTEILPYLAITDVPLHTPGQISFLQQVGHFSRNRSPFRSFPETLDEKDCGEDSDTEMGSQGAKQEDPHKEGLGRKAVESAPTGDPSSDAPLNGEKELEQSGEEDDIMDFDDDW